MVVWFTGDNCDHMSWLTLVCYITGAYRNPLLQDTGMIHVLAWLYGILGTIVITCYDLPWFAIFLVPIGILYYKIQV